MKAARARSRCDSSRRQRAGSICMPLFPLPLVPGDRFVFRESGRDETVGGGEVLDVAPVLPASKAQTRPLRRQSDRRARLDQRRRSRGADRRAPRADRSIRRSCRRSGLEATRNTVAARIAAAGDAGLDMAELDERQRAVANMLDDVTVEAGRARAATRARPVWTTIPSSPPCLPAVWRRPNRRCRPARVARAAAPQADRRARRCLLPSRHDRRGRRDGRAAAAELHPDGFTVAQLRDDLGASRKYALPLVNELDARGITRRRGDLRVAGPRLPSGGEASAPA